VATFVPAPQTAKVVLTGHAFGQTIINVLWAHFLEAITQAILDTLVSETVAWWDTSFRTNVSSDYTLDSVTAIDQTSQNGAQSSEIVNHAGLGGACATPLSGCMVISERTGLRGRSYRGRFYYSPIPSTGLAADRNQVTSTLATNVAVAFALIADRWAGMTPSAVHVIASHFTNGLPRSQAVVTPVETYHADTFIDSQRRRLTGRGT
jgi:hypothetical protein